MRCMLSNSKRSKPKNLLNNKYKISSKTLIFKKTKKNQNNRILTKKWPDLEVNQNVNVNQNWINWTNRVFQNTLKRK